MLFNGIYSILHKYRTSLLLEDARTMRSLIEYSQSTTFDILRSYNNMINNIRWRYCYIVNQHNLNYIFSLFISALDGVYICKSNGKNIRTMSLDWFISIDEPVFISSYGCHWCPYVASSSIDFKFISLFYFLHIYSIVSLVYIIVFVQVNCWNQTKASRRSHWHGILESLLSRTFSLMPIISDIDHIICVYVI